MPTDTTNYRFNHTMIRVKDPNASLNFYQNVLGMKLLTKSDVPAGKFTLYFLAYYNDPLPESEDERRALAFSIPGVLELTHNWGTELDESFAYHNGNKEPRGFGHIAVVVDDIEAACSRFEEMGVTFVKRLTDGTMKNIAFIADPDGYWVEILKISNPSHKH